MPLPERRPYTDPRWKQVRALVLARDGYRCQIRRPKCRGRANAVDHIIDWRDGGPPFDPANLRAACTACNTAQRNSRIAEAKRNQRNRTRW